MKATYLPILLAAALSLSACQTMNSVQNSVSGLFDAKEQDTAQAEDLAETIVAAGGSENCPGVEIMTDLKDMAQFTDYADPQPENKISEITMDSINADCAEQAGAVAMKIDITFDGALGPKAKANTGSADANFSYPYFIAVTDENGDILAKEIFAASLSYGSDQATIKQIETINQLLPKKGNMAGYTILLGFQLNEDQLMYNRANIAPAAGEEEPQGNMLNIE